MRKMPKIGVKRLCESVASDGYVHLPTGDYSRITTFDKPCVFAAHSIFGHNTTFTKPCIFGFKSIFV